MTRLRRVYPARTAPSGITGPSHPATFRRIGEGAGQHRAAGDPARAGNDGVVCGSAIRNPGHGVDEIDLEAGVWTVPASRMKGKRPHRVPLSSRAVEVLREARGLPHSTRAGVVFPGPLSGKMLSPPMMGALLKRLGIPSTLHGLARTTFRSWAAEQGADRQVAEAALAHVVKGVEGAYFATDLFERRAGLMERWTQNCV